MSDNIDLNKEISFKTFKKQVLNDFKTIVLSREASLLGRREVLNGKAKFGIFGDGKELPQIAMAKVFQKGDFRSGYYRDQTFLMAQFLLKLYICYNQSFNLTEIHNAKSFASSTMFCFLEVENSFSTFPFFSPVKYGSVLILNAFLISEFASISTSIHLILL